MMPFEPCHLSYTLTRRQRLEALIGVWKPYLPNLILLIGVLGLIIGFIAYALSWWWLLLLLIPLRGIVACLLDIAFVRERQIDIIIEENGLGFATSGDRLWLFLDGIIAINKFRADIWTISFHNGTVISIPSAIINIRYIEHLHAKMEYGRTPQGFQDAVNRGRAILGLKPEQAAGKNEETSA
jgi:hypothetical protein